MDTSYKLNYENNSSELTKSESEKDLGVTIDADLDFDTHINNKINTANKIFGIIRRAYVNLNPQTFIPLYKAMVRSHLDYAVSVWCPYKEKHIEALEKVQRRATKRIDGFKNFSYEERLKKLKLPTLKYRRIRGDMIECYKILNEVYDTNKKNFFELQIERNEGRILRGHSLKVYYPRFQKNIRKHSFPVHVIETWTRCGDLNCVNG